MPKYNIPRMARGSSRRRISVTTEEATLKLSISTILNPAILKFKPPETIYVDPIYKD
jgi:hypothetical protein